MFHEQLSGGLIEWMWSTIRAYAPKTTNETEYAQKLQRFVGDGTARRGPVADQSSKEASRS